VADFARNHWWHYGARLALGRLYAEADDAEHAVQALRAASWLDIHEVDALNLIARVRMRQHRFDDAYCAQKRAVARQPDAPRQYILLSDILEKMGQTAAAKDAIAQVARLEAIGRAPHALAN
jgi:tetratricopeptide (TPR) repeat protein